MKAVLLCFFLAAFSHARELDKLYKKAGLKIGKQKFSAYIADDDEGRAQGLMFIEKIPENTGMLFVFESERPLGFWMKNTLIPLSIGFFDAKGILIDVQEMRVAKTIMEESPPSYQSRGPALFALEMQPGWFSKHKIKIGSQLASNGRSPSTLLSRQLPPAKGPRH